MVQDVVRSCYSSSMRFYRDQVTLSVAGRWKFCPPGAKPLPFEHSFGSTNWLYDHLGDDDQVGEIDAPKLWYNGHSPGQATGQVYCGTPEQWLAGALVNDPRPFTEETHGVPPCCLPPDLPDFDDLLLCEPRYDKSGGFIDESNNAFIPAGALSYMEWFNFYLQDQIVLTIQNIFGPPPVPFFLAVTIAITPGEVVGTFVITTFAPFIARQYPIKVTEVRCDGYHVEWETLPAGIDDPTLGHFDGSGHMDGLGPF